MVDASAAHGSFLLFAFFAVFSAFDFHFYVGSGGGLFGSSGFAFKFSESLAREADKDLTSLGLDLDTLKIQNVSDNVNYLVDSGFVTKINGQPVEKG